jgi:hypothetical protein
MSLGLVLKNSIDPAAKARHQKAFGYISGRAAAAPPAALGDLAASNPAVRAAFERAGLLPISEVSARAAPPRPAPVREAAGDDPWDAAIAAVCAENGLKPRGGGAYAPGATTCDSVAATVFGEACVATRAAPSLVPHPTVRGAATWDSVIAQVGFEAGLDRKAGLSMRAAPSLAPHPTVRGAATWDSVIAQVSFEAGLTDKTRGRANE